MPLLTQTDIPSVDAQAKIRLEMIKSVMKITRTRQHNKAMIDGANLEYIMRQI